MFVNGMFSAINMDIHLLGLVLISISQVTMSVSMNKRLNLLMYSKEVLLLREKNEPKSQLSCLYIGLRKHPTRKTA